MTRILTVTLIAETATELDRAENAICDALQHKEATSHVDRIGEDVEMGE